MVCVDLVSLGLSLTPFFFELGGREPTSLINGHLGAGSAALGQVLGTFDLIVPTAHCHLIAHPRQATTLCAPAPRFGAHTAGTTPPPTPTGPIAVMMRSIVSETNSLHWRSNRPRSEFPPVGTVVGISQTPHLEAFRHRPRPSEAMARIRTKNIMYCFAVLRLE